MHTEQNINTMEDNDLQKIVDLIKRNYLWFILSFTVAIGIAFLINRYSIPIYKVSSSIIIKEENSKLENHQANDYLNSSLFENYVNFQNEIWAIKSTSIFEETINNLDLSVSYYIKKRWQLISIYKDTPFKVLLLKNHRQPINVKFEIKFIGSDKFELNAKAKEVHFYNFENKRFVDKKTDWSFNSTGTLDKLLENKDVGFIITRDTTTRADFDQKTNYLFELSDVSGLAEALKNKVDISPADKKSTSTVIELSMSSTSDQEGIDIINEIMHMYSKQNLDRKNHIASTTIEYIDKEMSDISDSLNRTEKNLQSFRSNKQLLNVEEQSTGIDNQYRELQNQKSELVMKKRYYDYLAENISKNSDYSNVTVPSSLGIQDNLINSLLSELINASSQKTNLIQNHQDKSPLIKKLDIQIESLKKTISDNLDLERKTTDISIDEMNKRIGKIEGEISRMPETQRQLGGIERKYKLNDDIYNYLLEKRAEAKITQASNMPDNIIAEPAKMVGLGPIFPRKTLNYCIALALGFAFPMIFFFLKSSLNNKIESQENIERITALPVLGKILHNRKKSNNIVFDRPNSNIAESYRALRTNLEFYVRGGHKKIILVTSCISGEGKSFNALNLAMCYAQLGRRTILLDFDLRKPTSYFNDKDTSLLGLTSYLINKATLDDIIINTQNQNFDFIASGPIPPNPVELLALEKTTKLLKHLKEVYDYIIIDTPPLAQVTDGYLLMEQADIKVIIARYNYSLKKVFAFVLKDLQNKNIDNICIVLNDNRIFSDQYGYGYGYDKKNG